MHEYGIVTALVMLSDDLLDKGCASILAFLDLSVALDTIDHGFYPVSNFKNIQTPPHTKSKTRGACK